LAVALLAAGCSKDRSVKPLNNNPLKITVKPDFASAATGSWQQVLGGQAVLSFKPAANDSINISPTTDTLSLSKLSAYTQTLFPGIYNISLNTESTAVADTFVRFTSLVNDLPINQTQVVTLQATTNDGVITINKTYVDTTSAPTFVAAGTTTVQNLGQANGYYFIYVTGGATGRVTFVEPTSGYTYMADIAVTATNQYDLSPIINTSAIRIHTRRFAKFNVLKK
jgi:hypothetical protein